MQLPRHEHRATLDRMTSPDRSRLNERNHLPSEVYGLESLCCHGPAVAHAGAERLAATMPLGRTLCCLRYLWDAHSLLLHSWQVQQEKKEGRRGSVNLKPQEHSPHLTKTWKNRWREGSRSQLLEVGFFLGPDLHSIFFGTSLPRW